MGLLSFDNRGIGERFSGLLQDMINLDPRNPMSDAYKQEAAARQAEQDWLKTQRDMQRQQMQAQQAAQQRRGSYLDSINPMAGPAMPVDPRAGLAAGLTPQELSAMEPKSEILNPGQVKLGPDGKPTFTAPFKPDTPQPTTLSKMLEERAKLPPGSPLLSYYNAAIEKETTRAEPMSFNLMAPTAGMVDGQPVMIQPANRPGQPAQVVRTADGKVVAPTGAGASAASEDERKAAGWFAQAESAFKNMEKVLKESPTANKPNLAADMVGRIPLVGQPTRNAMLTGPRQRFEQAASSFAEAALRAATGAGVNLTEAEQKIAELTPKWGDKPETVAQKRETMLMYLGSLQLRAGRAMPMMTKPAGQWSITKE
jgi:hypothetical protein